MAKASEQMLLAGVSQSLLRRYEEQPKVVDKLNHSAEVGSSGEKDPFISFSIEIKVGDAIIHAHGSTGQEEKARELVNKATKHLRK